MSRGDHRWSLRPRGHSMGLGVTPWASGSFHGPRGHSMGLGVIHGPRDGQGNTSRVLLRGKSYLNTLQKRVIRPSPNLHSFVEWRRKGRW